MAFDGIVTRAVARELSQSLVPGRIEKIYQPGKDELVFIVHSPTGRKKLYASCNSSRPGVFISEEDYQNPPVAPSFCMLLRKHLQNGKILQIAQKDDERIIEITVESGDEMGFLTEKKLIIEIMGRHSNITLVRSDDFLIIDGIKRLTEEVNRVRVVLPGRLYTYPPVQDKIPLNQVTPEDLSFKSPEPAKELLGKIRGISPSVAEEIAALETPSAMYKEIRQILSSLKTSDLSPAVYTKKDGTPADFHVLALKQYHGLLTPIPFDTVSQAISYYYAHRNASNRVKQKSADLSKAVTGWLKKLYLKKQRLLEDLRQAGQANRYRLYGELITANLHNVKRGENSVTLFNYYNDKEVTIPLNPQVDPSKNAQKYYKKYTKAKRAVDEKNIQLRETDMDIAYLESVFEFINRATTTEEVDNIREELTESGFARKRSRDKGFKKKTKSSPLEYFTSDGFRVLVGRNNKENDRLTFKLAGRKDIWLHTKNIPGSHVILFTGGKEVSDLALFEAAALAAYYSKGRESENVPVDYTAVRYVKKTKGARPGMVIFTDNKTVYVTPKLL